MKIFVVAMGIGAATIIGLKAGSASHVEESTPTSNKPFTFSLTVENGKGSGNYEAGTLVSVGANAVPSGAEFAGWTGDIAILSNPFLRKTVVTIPYMAVTITATYTTPEASVTPTIDSIWGG